MRTWIFVTILSLASATAHASPPKDTSGAFVRSNIGLSFISERIYGQQRWGTIGYGAQLGVRGEVFDASLLAEHSLWPNSIEASFPNVFNLGLAVGFLSAESELRSSLAAGISVMLFSTVLESRGTTGIFTDFNPIAWRFEVWGHTAEIAPLAFQLMIPSLDGIPLVRIVYRTMLSYEWSL